MSTADSIPPPKPLVLTILDGWGIRADPMGNAIHHAHTPNFDRWWQERPHALIATSGEEVGLPNGQMGNSEVGHLNLGTGRIVYQEFTRINRAILAGEFQHNPPLVAAIQQAVSNHRAVHILGLLSPGGVHSHTDHILATVRTAAELGAKAIHIHGFLDGRDTPPRSALAYLAQLNADLATIGQGQVATICGRYFAMDRDNRWDRVQLAYNLLLLGEGFRARDPRSAIMAAYERSEDDEFIQPTVILDPADQPVGLLQDGDTILMINFRADRMREICHALLDPDPKFQGFPRKQQRHWAAFLTMTAYDATLQGASIAFPPAQTDRILGHELARHGFRQLRAAETEKYAHVTYFFNGGNEPPLPGEDRLLIPSPQVATYDQYPGMSAIPLTNAVIDRIQAGLYDFIVVNFANPDMVGHTGNFTATVQAIETVDLCLGRLANATLAAGGELLITADHGNADQMIDTTTNQPHTAHTCNPAPLIYLGRRALLLADGRLSDIAPTLLQLLGLEQPLAMEGHSLVRHL